MANITDSDVKGLLATSSEDEDEPHVLDIGEQVVAASDSGDESDSDRIAKYKNLLAELTCKEEKSKKVKRSHNRSNVKLGYRSIKLLGT